MRSPGQQKALPAPDQKVGESPARGEGGQGPGGSPRALLHF